jgi:hypothetical protein
MKPISCWTLSIVFVLTFCITNGKHKAPMNSSRMLAFRNFGLNYHYSDFLTELTRRKAKQIEKEKLRQEEALKHRQEEKSRQIVNELLMPLTRGNKFMRDFYSGRY